MPPSFRRPSPLLARALPALLAVAAFLNTLSDRYTFDDVAIVRFNPLVHSLARWREVFHHDYWYPNWVGGLYRPLDILSFAVQWHFTPNRPAWFHLGNILLHAAVVVLVFGLARRLLSLPGAVFAAAWFAVLPTHVEVVAGLVGRAELGAALFALAAVLIAIPDTRTASDATAPASPARSRAATWRAALAAGLCTLVALGFKETAITTIGLAALLEWAVHPGDSLRRRLRGWITHPALLTILGASLVYLAVRVQVVGLMVKSVARVENPLAYAGAATRLRTALWIAWQYAAALLWPFHLAPDYSWRQIPLLRSWLAPAFLFSAAGLLLMVGLAVCGLRRAQAGPALLSGRHAVTVPVFALLFALAAWSPVSNLPFAIGTIRANRLLYLPSAGFAVALGWLVERIWNAGARRSLVRALLVTACLFLVAVYGVTDVHENRLWKNNLTLFQMAVERAPDSAKAHYLLGYVQTQRGNFPAAELQYHRALALSPHFARAAAELASALDLDRQAARALEWYRRAFALEPTREYFGRLVHAELRAGHNRAVLRLAHQHPGLLSPASRLVLGVALLNLGHARQALPLLESAARALPTLPQAHLDYARALSATGNTVEAAEQIQQARILALAALHAPAARPLPSVR